MYKKNIKKARILHKITIIDKIEYKSSLENKLKNLKYSLFNIMDTKLNFNSELRKFSKTPKKGMKFLKIKYLSKTSSLEIQVEMYS